MWNQFKYWLEHLFKPHCDECVAAKHCHNCEQLYMLLERDRDERARLVSLLHPAQQEQEQINIDYEAIRNPNSWRAQKAKLEREAFLKAHRDENANQ